METPGPEAPERILIQWDTDSHSMVEVEAICASLRKNLTKHSLSFTLSITGQKVPKFSELKKLLQILEHLVQKQGIFHVYCELPATKKLLEFCGFPFIAKFIEKRPSH